MRSFLSLLLCVVAPVFAAGQQQQAGSPLNLNDLVNEALRNSSARNKVAFLKMERRVLDHPDGGM